MLKDFYNDKDRCPTGIRTTMALALDQSLEWISRQMRWGGIPCRAEEYFRWYCAMAEGDRSAARQMHALISHRIEQMEEAQVSEWCQKSAAAEILTRAAAAVNALNDGEIDQADEHAALALKEAVDIAVARILARRPVVSKPIKSIRFEGIQPSDEPLKRKRA